MSDPFLDEVNKNKAKVWKWEVVRVGCVTVAQGWKCPHCGTIWQEKKCTCGLNKGTN